MVGNSSDEAKGSVSFCCHLFVPGEICPQAPGYMYRWLCQQYIHVLGFGIVFEYCKRLEFIYCVILNSPYSAIYICVILNSHQYNDKVLQSGIPGENWLKMFINHNKQRS